MLRRALSSLALLCTVGLAIVLWSGVAAAASDPTEQQIYQAASSGRLADAEQMIAQVLQDHPSSGKAHYVAAEVYARAGDLPRAREQLGTAQSLEPGLPFARPASVQELQRQLASGYGGAYAVHTTSAPRSSFPWGFVLLIAGVIAVWALVRRRAAMARAPSYIPYAGPGPGMQGTGAPMPGVVPPYGAAPYGVSPYGYGNAQGSGLMGSLASGLAVGAGVAAGEALMGHMLGSGTGGGIIPAAGAQEWADNAAPVNTDMGGNDFGITDGGSDSWDDGGGGGDFGGGGGDWT